MALVADANVVINELGPAWPLKDKSFSQLRRRDDAGFHSPKPSISVSCDDIIGPVPNGPGNDLQDAERFPRARKVARQTDGRVGLYISFPVRDEDECLCIILVKAKISHELCTGKRLKWRESENRLCLMAQDKLHRVCAKITNAIEDNDIVHGMNHVTDTGSIARAVREPMCDADLQESTTKTLDLAGLSAQFCLERRANARDTTGFEIKIRPAAGLIGSMSAAVRSS
jgi:hypothetical protein